MSIRIFVWTLLASGLGLWVLLGFRTEAHGTPQTPATCPEMAAQITFSDDNPQPGEPIDITVTIANAGSADASAFTTYLYVDPAERPPTATTPATTSRRAPGLVAGGQYSWTRTGHVFADAGQHVVYAWVDRDNQVPDECNEGNNLVMRTLTVGDLGCQPDAFEAAGDNTCATAAQVTPGATAARHTFCPAGDEDWITFPVAAGVEYAVAAVNVEDDAEVRLEHFLRCEDVTALDALAPAGAGDRLSIPVYADGVLYVRAANDAVAGGDHTAYDLAVTALCEVDAYEPDDSCARAQELLAGEPSQARSFCRARDEDWMHIWVTAGATYRLESQQLAAHAAPQLALYDQCDATPTATSAPAGVLEWTAAATGPQWVQVRNQAIISSGLETSYTLLLSPQPIGDDANEPDNDMAAAHPLPPAATPRTYKFATPGDQDWFYLDTVQGQSYRIETYDLGGNRHTALPL
jgi:hypothetical protein